MSAMAVALEPLPGDALVAEGFDDLRRGGTVESRLVEIGAPRPGSLGLDVPEP